MKLSKFKNYSKKIYFNTITNSFSFNNFQVSTEIDKHLNVVPSQVFFEGFKGEEEVLNYNVNIKNYHLFVMIRYLVLTEFCSLAVQEFYFVSINENF